MRATMQTSCSVHRAPGGRAVASARPAANALPAVRQAAAAAAAAALLLTSTPAFAVPPPLPKDAASAALAEQLRVRRRSVSGQATALARSAYRPRCCARDATHTGQTADQGDTCAMAPLGGAALRQGPLSGAGLLLQTAAGCLATPFLAS